MITLHYKEQLKKPLAQISAELLNEVHLDDFLNFVQFSKDNKFSLKRKASYRWDLYYKKKLICGLCLYSVESYIPDGSWSIWPHNLFFHEYDECITADNLKKLLVSSLKFNSCRGCNDSGCGKRSSDKRLGSDNLTLFGTNYKNVCSGVPFIFANPAKETLEHVKELILISKNIIDNNTVVANNGN